MAGFLKRVSRITTSKINAFLDGAERPEEVFPILVKELRAECQKAIEAEATAVAALKRRQRDSEDAETELVKWKDRAELAVRNGDDELAREAIRNQMSAENRARAAKSALDAAQVAADRAREARIDLQAKVDSLEQKRDEILARARAAKQREEVQKVLAGVEAGTGDSILEAVARMEEKVAESESRADAYSDVAASAGGKDTETKFRDLEERQAVEDRLGALKAKMSGGASDAKRGE